MPKSFAFPSSWRFSRHNYLIPVFLLLTLLFSALMVAPATVRAAGTVATCDETTLRTALTGGGTVTFSCSGTITLSSGNPIIITANTILDGTGQTVTISGGGSEIFDVNAGINFTVQNLTLSDGFNPSRGGAIFNNGGTVTVINSTFLNNQAFSGGAIYNDNNGTLVVKNSTFSGNQANTGDGGGGAIYNNAGVASVTNSTFYNNQAFRGGALYNGFGAGIKLNVLNVTISGNSALDTGGVYNDGGVTTITNTILDTNTNGNCGGGVNDGGHNLDSAATCAFTNAALNNTSAVLGALAANGGPTNTMALGVKSPAIDAGDSATCPATDQRYYSRVGICDIGAYEYNGAPLVAPTLTKAFAPATIAQGALSKLTISLTNPNGAALSSVSFTDNMPSQLQVAVLPGVTNNCATPGTVTATTGSSAISISGLGLNGGQSCTISVNITGNTVGTWTNTINSLSTAETGLARFNASASLTVTPGVSGPGYGSDPAPGGTLYVGAINPGKAVSAKLMVIETGTATLTVSSPVIGGPNAAEFTIVSPAFPFNIADGGTPQAITIQCVPSVLGTRKATLMLTTNDPAQPTVTYNLVCLGAVGGPQLPADLVGQLRVTPDRVANTGSENLISFKFTVINLGQGQAERARLVFPLDANLALGYTSFSDPHIWVTEVVTDSEKPYVKIAFPVIEPGKSFSGTIFFRPAAKAKSGAIIFSRFDLTWDDAEHAGKKTASNAVRFELSADKANLNESGGEIQILTLTANKVANKTKVTITGDFYAPKETVNFWFTKPDGTSYLLGTTHADKDGKVSFELIVTDWEVGKTYAIAGQGVRSRVIGGDIAITVIAPPAP